MIHLTAGQTATLTLTLSEAQTIAGANYLFIFERRIPDAAIAFVLPAGADTSTAKDRYNRFTIDVADYFTGATIGQYDYNVYQQTSIDNTDPQLSDGLLETGIAMLHAGAHASVFISFNPTTTFTVPNG